MEKETIDGIEIKTSWDQITLGEFMPLAEIEKDTEMKKTPLRFSFERIKILTGKTEEELMNLPGDTFGHLINAAKFLDKEPTTMFKEKGTFFIGEVEYCYRKPAELNAGEYISLESEIAAAIKHKRSMLPGILAILIRPAVRTPDKEFGEMIDVEPFDVNKYPLRVEFFKQNLYVPFFIHALNRITSGANGIKQVAKNFTSKGNTTLKGKRSKKK